MNPLDIANAIRDLENPSLQDLQAIKRMLDFRMNAFRYTPRLGDTVTFDAKTRGVKKGIVTKVNIKTCKVLVQDPIRGAVTWNCSTNLLHKAN